ncbi:MAG TPA: beta-ketoacyl-[acyl-carrier-protein] synthase II, partial [Thermomonas sp.]|nr:beta-ketoacyl-[acyl-carrier-protein] synthase II [Thermomonas sp.]
MTAAPVFLNALGMVCALGQGQQAVADALFASDAPRGVMQTDAFTPGRVLMLGAVPGALAELQD